MLGGRHPRANIEVHDVVFVAAPCIEQAYPQLRDQWFGAPAGLHLDSWMAVDGVDRYRVRLSTQPPAEGPKLYFVNLGGYVDGAFGEEHGYLLVAAADPVQAKATALRQAAPHWLKPHRDALLDVDDCLRIGAVAGLHVHLVPGAHDGIAVQSDYLLLP
ncbi:DUF1543 domain-containing protein [Stenotrophomonas sp. CPCC 101365]|uniref:DUF1543 domain-containing protein n=2 Tax=Stenotrophomonas mori TaxID=2871096 RepID=A0ABT0SJ93_9GAMM|nr:DUF1543 domain-containing protein [Stenotrophomonas mori]MCL7715388.1 DUF1543 domain-containing protein [Stenotrophomonas mori]